MQAGALNKRLDFETPNTVADTFGEETEAPYTLVASVWGSIEPLSGNELLRAQQTQAEVTHRVRIRYRTGITPKLRIAYADRYFNILSVINRGERNRELEIMCKELV